MIRALERIGRGANLRTMVWVSRHVFRSAFNWYDTSPVSRAIQAKNDASYQRFSQV